MNYEVLLTKTFQNSLKILKKKYPSAKDDLLKMIHKLESDPTIGAAIQGWDSKVWKVRTASSDARKGKSGGFRTIYYWESCASKVYLLFVYAKTQQIDVKKREIEKLLKVLLDELGPEAVKG